MEPFFSADPNTRYETIQFVMRRWAVSADVRQGRLPNSQARERRGN
jgi:hypothetical protein